MGGGFAPTKCNLAMVKKSESVDRIVPQWEHRDIFGVAFRTEHE